MYILMRMYVVLIKMNNMIVYLGVNKGLYELSFCWENFEYFGCFEFFFECCIFFFFCNFCMNLLFIVVIVMVGN